MNCFKRTTHNATTKEGQETINEIYKNFCSDTDSIQYIKNQILDNINAINATITLDSEKIPNNFMET